MALSDEKIDGAQPDPICWSLAALKRPHERCSAPRRAFYHNFVWLERFDRAGGSAIDDADILGTADVQCYRLPDDRPSPANHASDALTERIADEPPPPHLRCESSVGTK